MRYFVDARMAGPSVTRGIGRVIAELVPRVMRRMSGVSWVVLVRFPEQRTFFADISGVEILGEDIPWYGWQEQLHLPRIIREARVDAAFFLHWNIPWRCPVPFGVFLHDLILLHEPTSARVSTRHPWMAWVKHTAYRHLLARVVRRARWIGVPTRYVAEDIAKNFQNARAKLHVIGEGVSTDVSSQEGARKSQCLIVSSPYPHKRLDLALRAWKHVSERFPEYTLRIVCKEDVFQRRLRMLAEELNLSRIVWIDEVLSEEELQEEYARAKLFVFPSSDEGFGLPPIEALLHGVPVLSSDAACMPEVLPRLGVRFFQSGSVDGMIDVWTNALDQQEALIRELPEARAWVLAHHQWDDAAKRCADLVATTS